MFAVLLTLYLIVCFFLVVTVLLQRSEGGALGIGGGGGNILSGRGAADALTRTTTVLGAAFLILSLVLTMMSQKEAPSVVEKGAKSGALSQPVAPANATPLAPSVPLGSIAGQSPGATRPVIGNAIPAPGAIGSIVTPSNAAGNPAPTLPTPAAALQIKAAQAPAQSGAKPPVDDKPATNTTPGAPPASSGTP